MQKNANSGGWRNGKMMILVLGGLGKQGLVIARDLINQSPLYQVDIADGVSPKDIPSGAHSFVRADLSDIDVLKNLMMHCDLAVCALPADLGLNCIKAALETNTHMVDLSFSSEDLLVFDQEAKDKGLTIITDAGVAPGLSNLVVGRAMLKNPNSIDIIVGGVPQERGLPFEYTITWSLDDLMAEYTRPARILVNGIVQTIPALSGVEKLTIGSGADGYEAFYTDGLRSLLTNNGGVPNLTEKTLRWPGHVKEIQQHLYPRSHTSPILSADFLKHEMSKACKTNEPDMLIMRIRADNEEVTMVTNSDEYMSAMAKTTALSCATFASLIASKKLTATGILPPEMIAGDDAVYKAVLDKMESHGVVFSTKYPFI